MAEAEGRKVKIEPVKSGDNYLTTIAVDNKYITDADYHRQRSAVMNMRNADPKAAALYDKFIANVDNPRTAPPLANADMDRLKKSAEFHKVGINSIGNAVGSDLKAHKYESGYRPDVRVNVGPRAMHAEIVTDHLKSAGVQGKIETIRSQSPGTISGEISFSSAEAAKLLPGKSDTSHARMLKEQVMLHAGVNPQVMAAEVAAKNLIQNAKAGAAGDIAKTAPETAQSDHARVMGGNVTARMGNGLMKVGAGLATGLAAGVAAAAEPNATPKSVALAAGDEAVPGFRAARQPDATITKTALAIGDDMVPGFKLGRQGQMCKAFGEAAGTVAAGATVAVGATATTTLAVASAPSVVAPVAIATGGAVLTAKAAEGANALGAAGGEAACNAAVSGYNKVKAMFGMGGP